MDTPVKKIFLVDDDAFHLNMMKQILEGMGQTDVTIFESGVDCLDALHQNPEIIFLDHNMDVYSGFEVLKKIKRFNPNIFVVMVSAQEDIQTAVDSLKHGAFDYIRKESGLEETIRKTLEKIDDIRDALRSRKKSIFKSFLSLL
ncbi:MAG: response regulator [Cryomorphaceae bacterium]|nr:response regulator [Cryomorphaceae bacterium]